MKIAMVTQSGLPLVASSVGANAFALQRFSGLQVISRGSWSDAMTVALTESADLLRQGAEPGRASVSQRYTFIAWEQEWRRAGGVAA
jgi:hypothetical protein